MWNGLKKPKHVNLSIVTMNRSRISNTEWGILMGVMILIDITQVILDIFLIGLILNRFIDIIVGMALPFYLYMRGVKMTAKKIWSMVGSFGLEFSGIGDVLPLWTLDVALIMTWEKAEEKVEGSGLGAAAKTISTRRTKKIPPIINRQIPPAPSRIVEREREEAPESANLVDLRNNKKTDRGSPASVASSARKHV